MRLLLWTVLPAMLIALLYVALLGYRRDYVGHFSAGYGGTLGAVFVVFAATALRRNRRGIRERQEAGAMLPHEVGTVLPDQLEAVWPAQVVVTCLLCIGLGAVFEATVFRLARFDEVDFCNQSLGAVLAGLAALAAVPRARFSRARVSCAGVGAAAIATGLAVSVVYLAAGFYCAFS